MAGRAARHAPPDDSFFSFQLWLIGFGRETVERIAADPDALADVPEARGLERVVDPEPEDDPRDEAQRAASLLG